jgi:flagellar biosynthesis regulator FlbT
MHAATSFKVDEDNIPVVQDLIKTRELSSVLNALLRQYRDKNTLSDQIKELADRLVKKTEQYEALKREIESE